MLSEQLNARIPLRPMIIEENDRSALVLRGTVPTEAVLPLRDAIGIAVVSLLEDPAYPQEWKAAVDRARLRFQAEVTTRDGWLRAATATLRHPNADNFEMVDGEVAPVDDQPLDPWVYGQALILRSNPDRFAPFLELVLGKVPLVFALGGEPIRTKNVFPLQNALLSDRRLEVTIAPDEERRQRAAEQWRETVSALGGGVRLAGASGYSASSVTRTGRGPEIAERTFASIDGRFRRVRRVLETTIHTVGSRNSGYDRIEGKKTELSFDDLSGQKQELLRNPVFLAGRVARGEDRYRLVSVRQVRDRELLILERLDDTTQALQVWTDSESGLIRTVRSLETRADGQVWVREDYFDYRDTGNGIRAPFQRHSSLDGSLRGLTTEWTAINFGPLADEDLNDGR